MIRVISKYWWVFCLRGLIAIVFGLAALLWPILTLGVMVLLFGFFALFEGLLTIVLSLKKGDGEVTRTLAFEGVVGILACIVVLLGLSFGAILWPLVTAVILAFYVAGWAIVAGLFKIITAFRIRRKIKGEWMLGLNGCVSILFGLILILNPGAGVVAAAWLIGIYAIFIGVFISPLGLRIHRIGEISTSV